MFLNVKRALIKLDVVMGALEKLTKTAGQLLGVLFISLYTIGMPSVRADGSSVISISVPKNVQDFAKLNSIVITSTVSEGGLHGVSVRTIDLQTGRFREENTLGINHEAHGFDGQVSWSEDSGSRVRIEGGEFARTETNNEAYRNCLGYWFPNRFMAAVHPLGRKLEGATAFDTFSVQPRGGRSFELWFDAETRLPIRLIEEGFYKTFTTVYSDFKWIRGLPVPFSTKVSSGDARFDRLEEIQGIQADPVLDDNCFSVPREGDRDFTVGSPCPHTIPFRLISNLVIVDGVLNGKTMPFILDTGGVNLVFPETVKELGLISEGQFSGFGGGQSEVTTSQLQVDSIELASAFFHPQIFKVYPFPTTRAVTGLPNLAGLLGYEIFKRFVVKIDYPERKVTFWLPEAYQYKGDGIVIPFHFVGNAMEVDGVVNSNSSRLLIDTGNTGSLILNSPWVNSHRDLFPNAFEKVHRATGGTGGKGEFAFAPIKSLSIGGCLFKDVEAALSMQTAGATANKYGDGIAGAELFLKSAVVFDYTRQQIIVERHYR